MPSRITGSDSSRYPTWVQQYISMSQSEQQALRGVMPSSMQIELGQWLRPDPMEQEWDIEDEPLDLSDDGAEEESNRVEFLGLEGK